MVQMNRVRIAVAAAVAFLSACSGSEKREAAAADTAASMADMAGMHNTRGTQNMEGMPGMAMGGDGPIRVTARQAALAGVTFAVARQGPIERTVRAVAMAVPNERGLAIVNARVSGWVERLHANETGRLVRAGEPLLELYAPELVTAQEELLLAKRLATMAGADSLVAASRRRLALWNIAEEEIAEIERTGEVRRRLIIRAPSQGYILEKQVIEGQMIQAGAQLFKIADLSTIWIELAIFESDIPLVRVGQRAEVTFDALPGHLFRGRVTFVYPELDMRTRTLRVRVEVPNGRLLVKPMMYGAVRIATNGPRGVVVPLTAVLPTGTRDLAFVVRQGGMVPTEVVVGSRGDSTVLVADGLAPGDTVVASATFLFDSESQLAAAMAGIMLNMGMGLDMGGMPMETGKREAGRGMRDMPGMDTTGRRP
jgi:Cu(I)/Ag(I) efflux system membrane fusion protein